MPDEREPLKGDDYVFTSVPSWLPRPLRRTARDLIYDEAHAMELGLVGILAGAGWWAGYHGMVLAASAVLVALAFGVKRLPADGGALGRMDNVLGQLVKSVAGKVIRREPWYFTTVYLAMAVSTAGGLEVIL